MIVNPELIRNISVDHEGIHNGFAAGDALTKRARVVSVHLAIWLLYIFYESSILFIIDSIYVNV